ncbi:MAG: AI-2E family transporter [Granulosicoccus sp.]|nr:AI-2E family transporter [Granulosicoccus sp.]
MQQQLINRSVLIMVLIAISIAFVWMLRPFLVSIFLAALFSALSYPLYRAFLRLVKKPALASLSTLLVVFLFVVVPLGLIGANVVSQAVDIANVARPWVIEQLAEPGMITAKLKEFSMYEQLVPYREFLIKSLGDFVGGLSKLTVDLFQSLTVSTFNALLMGLIVLYTMFFLLIDGDKLLYYVLYYLPLSDDEEKELLERFTSVTRATLKGTAVIGILQGGLNGMAFAFAGIPSALFWAVAMMFLSVVPGIGTAAVWVPAVLYLVGIGEVTTAIMLALFSAVVVGSVDNLLRPKLVGNDTQMHELLIFFSTLGGLVMFGFWGFVIGPIIAALFVTIWQLYGYEFGEWLPTTAYTPRSGPVEVPAKKKMIQDADSAITEPSSAGPTNAGAQNDSDNPTGRSDPG